MPQAGRAQPFAGEQVVRDRGAGDGVLVFKQQAGVLENTLLAGGVHIHHHIGSGQDGGETVHGVSPASRQFMTGLTTGPKTEK